MTMSHSNEGLQPQTGASVFILDESKRCEPSAFLFTQAVRFFLENGYTFASRADESDVILVNTCCVTEDKIASSKSALALARQYGSGKRIVLFGCLASLPASGIDKDGLICIGPQNLTELDVHFTHRISIVNISVDRLSSALYSPGQGLTYDDYFLMIGQGCVNNCSYCNIKRAKGPLSSVPIEVIVQNLKKGLSEGVKLFTLLADDCASYGRDRGTDLVDLLELLFSVSDGFGFKLGYLYPQFLLTHFDGLKRIFETGRIPYVNVPVQSGSPRILKTMNRVYDPSAVVDAVSRLKALSPKTTFCTHIMINFPGETHEDFIMSLMVANGFDEVLFLNYSDNEGTEASRLLPKVNDDEARRRLDLASHYANHQKRGRSAVIKDFDCDAPYNVTGPFRG
jgi:threonylcarbamoyladenosine tRNA methylthiotransferase CDKAL1